MRLLLLGCLALMLIACSSQSRIDPGGQIPIDAWQAFKQNFIDAQGRVIDRGNDDISHSEGQGYAMLLAVAANDAVTFEQLWQWTQTHLPKSPEGLFAWRWRPHAQPAADDPNNASDGEILMAWALARAAVRFNQPRYRDQAVELAQAVRKHLLRPSADGLLLVPGAQGFEHAGYRVVNLSYWVFGALVALDAIDPSPAWQQLQHSGRQLLHKAQFGEAALPPDWLRIDEDGEMRVADGWPPRFSFDAIRIPLYACWSGVDAADFYKRVDAFWSSEQPPAWVDLTTGEVAPYPLSAGGRLIRDFMQHCMQTGQTVNVPPPVIDDNYYSSVLSLLVALAASERTR